MILGEQFGPVPLTVDEHVVKCYAFAQDDYSARYAADGRAVAHPLLLGNHLLRVYEERHERHVNSGALHTQEEVWYSSPVLIGERVMISGRYVDAYKRRGRPYLVLEASAHGEDGRLLLRHRATEALGAAGDLTAVDQDGRVIDLENRVGQATAERVTGEVDPTIPAVSRAHPAVMPGTALVPLRKRLTQEQMSVFSGAGQYERNLHTDLESARGAGLERPIAQGLQVAGHISELLAGFFGTSWFTSGWQRIKFVKPVPAGEALTVHGVVRAMRPVAGELCAELEVWVVDSVGDRTAIGWATGTVSSGC
ncbi:MAG TPA: MaoC family dehydratase [Kribbella sp.]